MSRSLTIATRGSKLALWQAHHVRDRLLAVDPTLKIELSIIKTTGDKIVDRPLSQVGGKGLFVKEIEQALIDKQADIAVHSMKDVPAELAPGLHMAAISDREDPRDALVTKSGKTFDNLPSGSVLGTSSLRRACQLAAARPDIEIVPLRGNVPTRLARVTDGDLDATVLAAAGLNRLGLAEHIHQLFDPSICLPAAGQGALGIETREGDSETASLVIEAVHEPKTASCIAAERGFLAKIGGGCQAPLAAYALREGDSISLSALIGHPDGSQLVTGQTRGPVAEGPKLGADLADRLLAMGGAEILAALDL